MNSRGMRKRMTVLVDSWAWIEYFKGTCAGEKVKELLENSQDKVIVSAVNIAEVYNSFLRDYFPPDNKRSKAGNQQRHCPPAAIDKVVVEIVLWDP